ncbi:Uncharacterized protein TCM_029184 [Theobroma cacao]|uniref:Uncharacterized protein n=1 Tax=Theobroma cacao TaxID=3641 RepID=A0A061GD34_THECC|nr:Uncharacterized protein TCM_029184 [Theobroma cacao]
MINTLSDETRDALSTSQGEIGELIAHVNLLIIAAGNASANSGDRRKRAQVLEPKRYEGFKDAKELKEDKLVMVSMYLAENVKLWWCSKFINEVVTNKISAGVREELLYFNARYQGYDQK